MSAQFDNIIKKNIDKSQLPDLSSGFTERIIRDILVNKRKLSVQPLLPKSVIYSILAFVTTILAGALFISPEGIHFTNESKTILYPTSLNNIVTSILNLIPDLSVLYLLIAVFLVIDILIGKIFHNRYYKSI